jgi:CheY-like chemotaxis protein
LDWGEARSASSTPEPARPRLSGRILLAEDGPDNQRLISHILQKAGATVRVAENGLMACDLAQQAERAGAPYELILMDMQMPVLDGFQATARLRREGYERPIVALTAFAMASDKQRCLDAGCDDYATKPIDRAKFLDLVARYLPKSASAQQASAVATAE